jgi:chromosome segregation ATPase
MQSFTAIALLLLVGTPLQVASDNPLSSVIALLDSLAAKVTADGEAEAKVYKEYVEWCDNAAANVNYEIKTTTSKKEALEATIAKATDDASASASKVEDLAASISADEGELKDATTVREKEAADFAASEAELVDAIDTLGRAIVIIEREMAKNPALVQQANSGDLNALLKSISAVVDAASFSVQDQKHLVALVQARGETSSDDDDFGAPAAATYKSHSSNIVDVLEDLKEKAEEELGDLRKAESNSKHNFQMLRQSLQDQMAADTKDMNEQKAAKAEADETKATAVGDLATTTKDLANAKDVLQTTGTTCMTVAADHEATVAGRNEELATIAKARKILMETSSGAVEQTYSFLQAVQMSGSTLHTRTDLANAEIVNIIKKLARQHHSAALAQLASKISAVIKYGSSQGDDPFVKVRGLIADMIAKLEKEAGAEASEKAYCDEEMSKTATKKQELDYEISKLTSKIDKAAAKSASLKDSVKTLQKELADVAKSQASMDKYRQEEHAAYTQAKADLELGLSGVRKALSTLRDYYGSAASASMLQDGSDMTAAMEQPAAPVKFEKASGAGGSIIDILEVVESDFAKNLASEETQEADASASYEKMTQENKITQTLKDQDVKYQTQEFKALDKALAELSSDRETTNTELGAVLEYDAQLKARCIAKPETYEDRKQRREAEIAGLKEALSILNGEALVQRKKRGFQSRFLGHD